MIHDEHIYIYIYIYEHTLWTSLSEVTLFLVCYGYMESQHRAFLFGGFEREIVLLFLTVFHQLLQSLFIVAWETLTDRRAPGGYSGLNKTDIADSLRIAAMTQDLDWFIRFILFGRIVMVVNHKLGIPSFVQMAACLAMAWYLPLPSREGRLVPGAVSIGYMLMLIGAYVAPDSWQDRQDSFHFRPSFVISFFRFCIVKKLFVFSWFVKRNRRFTVFLQAVVRMFGAHWNGASQCGRSLMRLVALAYMIASIRPPLGFGTWLDFGVIF